MSDNKALVVSPRSFAEVQTMAETLSKSDLLPAALKGKIPDLVFSILAGQELGLAPIASIRGIHVIAGKPILAADTMMGLVLGSGLAEYFVQTESTATSVTFETKRKGSPIAQKCTWTIEDAKRAGINIKDTWRQYPRQMLASRAKAELARSAFPDILAGCYDPDEISSAPTPLRSMPATEIPSDTTDVVDVEDVADSLESRIQAADSLDALKLLAKECNSLKRGSAERVAALATWHSRQDALVKAAAEPTPSAEAVA